MGFQMTVNGERAVARPLKILIPLIKDEIVAGDAAGLEHYRAAGELLLEAKSQQAAGKFVKWFEEQNFGWGIRQAQRYMALADIVASQHMIYCNF